MSKTTRETIRSRRWQLILLIALLAILAAVGALLPWWLEGAQEEPRSAIGADFGLLTRKEYEGHTYVERSGLTSILLIGVDRPSGGAAQRGYRSGGQADFLLLAVVDPEDSRVSLLQIDRDTIADVVTLGVLGNEVGTRRMQICLSHSFGATQEENCYYTARAVSNLLEGESVGLYYALSMDGIPVMNDLLGGVTVTFPEDWTDVDPAFLQGATVTLSGEQVLRVCRLRMTVGDGTNASRMIRQRLYLNAAQEALLRRLKEDSGFADALTNALGDSLTTNIPKGQLVNEALKASSYEILPIATLPGEHTIGSDGFVEFHADEDALVRWVLDAFYRQEA